MGQSAKVAIRDDALPPAQAGDPLIDMIERAARDPQVDIDKMERLVAMQERAFARRAEEQFNAYMSAAQAQMKRVAVDSANPQTKSKFASYAALDRVMRPIYTEHGFALSFGTEASESPDFVRVTCHVTNGGHTRKYQIDMPADGKGAKGGDVMTKTHAVGSAATYGQRYLLKMIFNIAVGNDDDGNKAADTGERISEAQVTELIDLCEAVAADRAKFCKYLKVETLADLAESRFEEAKKALQAKGTR